ncbi:hypothetical protein [Actinoplanes sp. NBRC 103695]|uniref:hypothetical protein n=1 Tax=Actinoplanes sp. NBRC 103695 TaxID=3032202 RepID=UPI0024A16732|nr:hypothetical protein [Actinoplanes sp. NBRC 103695]GLZ00098.1 hypothetical protein Acsp02_73500 [Actinoplanes sp. NBRC 103695]
MTTSDRDVPEMLFSSPRPHAEAERAGRAPEGSAAEAERRLRPFETGPAEEPAPNSDTAM